MAALLFLGAGARGLSLAPVLDEASSKKGAHLGSTYDAPGASEML